MSKLAKVPVEVAPSCDFGRAFERFRSLLPAKTMDAMQPLGPATVYTASVTVWLLVHQRLNAGCSLLQAVEDLLQQDPTLLPSNKRIHEQTLSVKTVA